MINSIWPLVDGPNTGQKKPVSLLRRALVFLIASILTGAATEIGRELVASEQFHLELSSMLHWGHGQRKRPPSASTPPRGPPGEAASTRLAPPPQDGLRPEMVPAPPSPDAAADEGDHHRSARLTCRLSRESPWQYESGADSVIWKCIGRSYFEFQCSADELALITRRVAPLVAARFFRYEHLAGHDAVLVAKATKQYYYYSLTPGLFALFREAFFVSFTTENADMLILDLTDVKRLSSLAFPTCIGT